MVFIELVLLYNTEIINLGRNTIMTLSRVFNSKAFLLHFIFSFLLIGGLAFFIVNLWYPDILATVLGGYKLVAMIVVFDLCVGPLCVGFAYKPHKSKKANTFDVVVITLCQLAFFSWGAWTISISRPVFIAFEADRFELIVDMDVKRETLADNPPFDAIPFFKSFQMAVVDVEQTVADENARIEAYNDSVFGLDNSKSPKYYVPYEGGNLDKVLNMAKDYGGFAKNDEAKAAVDDFIKKHKLSEKDFKWLPIRYFSPAMQQQMFMTAVISHETAEIIGYIEIDPYEI